MFSAEDLYGKLKEIESLIREKTNPDGSLAFEARPVMVSLEMARRMVLGMGLNEENAD